MKVYIDIVLIINYIFDFILLLSTSVILKRNIIIKRIILGSLFGSLTILFLFIEISSFELLIYKIIVSIIMCLITFKYKNIKYFLKNLYYLYMISIILGGFLYLINNQYSYQSNNIIFIKKSYKQNVILGIVLSIIFLYFYIKNIKDLNTNFNIYYNVELFYKGNKIKLNGFLDTGNKLFSPYNKYPIILVNKSKIKYNNKEIILVPYYTLNNNGLLECIKPDKIYIENIGYKKKFLIGLSKQIKIEGIDCILNEKLLED